MYLGLKLSNGEFYIFIRQPGFLGDKSNSGLNRILCK